MQSSELNANKENICTNTNTVILASLQFISDKVGDNLNRGNSEHQGRFVEGGSSRKSSKSVKLELHESLGTVLFHLAM